MGATHGKNGYFKLKDLEMKTHLESAGLDRSNDVVEVTTFCNDSKKYIQGINDGTIPLEGNWNVTVDDEMALVEAAGEVDWEYGPAGDTLGLIKYSGKCILTAYNISQDANGKITFSATLQLTGDVERGTFA